MEIKAIETIYNGRRYHSRLEARWAVFFDSLGIRFEYEPEGFVLSNGMAYLPDFFLPDIGAGIFAEVRANFEHPQVLGRFYFASLHDVLSYSKTPRNLQGFQSRINRSFAPDQS